MIKRAFNAIASFPSTLVDRVVSTISPTWGVQRMQARRVLRHYSGAESSRLNSGKKPKNQSAETEAAGPWGADQLRAWARMLVRDNAYAWGVLDTIVCNVVGCGISAISMAELPDGEDDEDTNESRDKVWSKWCKTCDLTGQLHFHELQALAQREITEAGEVLIHRKRLKHKKYRGVFRPVPLALELIEADRLATEMDTYQYTDTGKVKIVRGIEIDDEGRPVAYWVYDDHPNSPFSFRRKPRRIPASDILHLYRKDRVGQSRGVTWYAPVVEWLRTLGVYVDNEMQASAVASCFTVAIKTDGTRGTGLQSIDDEDQTDSVGNTFEYVEPAMVMNLNPGESIETANPGRPNSNAAPWISLILRGIAVGTGLSYETVARDYSQTTYSSNRSSQQEDRRRFRRWQDYIVCHLCDPVWAWFCEAAAFDGHPDFPEMRDLLDDFEAAAPVDWQRPTWEWVDPVAEQTSSQAAIEANQSSFQLELAGKGVNWRRNFKQRAKEERLARKLGLTTYNAQQMAIATESLAAASADLAPEETTEPELETSKPGVIGAEA